MSLKELLVSAARHRSSANSAVPSSNSTEYANPTESSSEETVLHRPQSHHNIPAKSESYFAVNTSDGDSSANLEIPTTPSGSHNSSVVSNRAERMEDTPPTHSSSPQGLRIFHDVPSIVMLSPMKPQIPRLQIVTDSTGRSFPGEGILQIAIISRTFGANERDIIGATTKYIVYALKGSLPSSSLNFRRSHSYY